jgi:hypothetical protein
LLLGHDLPQSSLSLRVNDWLRPPVTYPAVGIPWQNSCAIYSLSTRGDSVTTSIRSVLHPTDFFSHMLPERRRGR